MCAICERPILLGEAREPGTTVTLHAECFNQAMKEMDE